MKKTRQGVRDLNSLPGKSVGRVLDFPVNQGNDLTCRHFKKSRNEKGMMVCRDCDAEFDRHGTRIT